MDKFGLIGHPIAHSLSPRLFTAAYAGKYAYDLIETPDFGEAWERFLSDYKAINVTAPFKMEAFAKADWASPECAARLQWQRRRHRLRRSGKGRIRRCHRLRA